MREEAKVWVQRNRKEHPIATFIDDHVFLIGLVILLVLGLIFGR